MVGFSRKFNVSYDALVMFVDEKFNYRDRHHCLSSSIKLKIESILEESVMLSFCIQIHLFSTFEIIDGYKKLLNKIKRAK